MNSSLDSADHTLLTSPTSAARPTFIFAPSTIISIARDFPSRRPRRCVPPVPGSTPSATSGRPIWKSPARAMRMSHASATSSPPPTA
jgi:hypothetical protein